MDNLQNLRDHLVSLYGKTRGGDAWIRLEKSLTSFQAAYPGHSLAAADPALTERDIILITYGDQIREPGRPPLETLKTFLEAHLADAISAIHILPFYPYTSDDGFSVSDYQAVDPDLGSWDDISRLGEHFQLMFDAVLNHISSESAWFRGFLAGKQPFTELLYHR